MNNQSLVVYENNVLTEFIKIKNHSIKMSLLQIHVSIILITVLLPVKETYGGRGRGKLLF